jgi:hypothetical protein
MRGERAVDRISKVDKGIKGSEKLQRKKGIL